ncbi:tetratricopeptide repeat protein [Brucella sp. IR073]|uniref:tetratricopeptide repeat protein n=1 Tax=unclassified Brucella TaxID=2632610 RepID=UPI003B98595D
MSTFMRMRNVFAILTLALFPAASVPAANAATPQEPAAAAPENPAGATEAQKRSARLDRLFGELRKERDEAKAKRIASEIYGLWNQSGSATIDLMMGWASDAIAEKKYPVAIDFLNEIVTLKPDYAEGWNRRATLFFLMNDYTSAMRDIDRALRLEPRHFAALTGMGSILRETGRKELALRAYERALAVYPMLRDAQKEAGEITDELTDTRT